MILIGDMAEIDADIYLRFTEEFPDRGKAIYLRSVTEKFKVNRMLELIEKNAHIDIATVYDGSEAIRHAKQKGLVL